MSNALLMRLPAQARYVLLKQSLACMRVRHHLCLPWRNWASSMPTGINPHIRWCSLGFPRSLHLMLLKMKAFVLEGFGLFSLISHPLQEDYPCQWPLRAHVELEHGWCRVLCQAAACAWLPGALHPVLLPSRFLQGSCCFKGIRWANFSGLSYAWYPLITDVLQLL